MFKNSKLLKGVFLALAVVLVLGAGVVLKLQANAEANTVVFYVSEYGNNTTGKDAATAFTTFAKAITEAEKLGLAPGTELKLIVPKQVYIEAKNFDGTTTLKDTAGNKVRIIITSENTGSQSEYATILHHQYNSSGSTSDEKIILHNDITFKDIIISAEAQPFYQSNAPMTDPVDYSKLYRTRHMHIGANDVVFDNCEITSTIPDKSKSWTFYCDSYASSSVAGVSSMTLKNGNYSNVTVYVQDQVTPYWDLSLTVDNATVGTVYAMADTDTGTSTNAKSITCTFNDATVSAFNPMGRGNVAVTEGVTAIFEGDTVVKNWTACMSSSSSTGNYQGDLRYYFRDNCSITATTTDSNSEAIIYLAPTIMTGDLHVTVEGGTFKSALCTGTDKNKSLTSTAAVLNGNIYNEFKGGTFQAGLYCGMGRGAGTINGNIYNNFYDGFYLEKGTSYLASRLGDINGDVYNNWYGGSVAKVEIYMGGGYGDANSKNTVLDGKLVTNIYDGTFNGTFWGASRSQTVTEGVYTTYMGGTFASTFVAGGLQIITPEIHTVFKNGPDGSYATFKGTSYLGIRGGSYDGTYNVGELHNTFEGDVNFKGVLYCADGTQSKVMVEDKVVNNFKGGLFEKYVWCSTATKSNVITATVENNFYDGAVFMSRVMGGGQSGGCGSITNNYYGGEFQTYVYGVSEVTTDKSYTFKVNGDVTNNYYGGTFKSQVLGSGMANCSGTLTNNYYGGTFKYFVYGISNAGNYTQMSVTNNIYGGVFEGIFIAGSNMTQQGSITNNVYGGHFTATHKEAKHSEMGVTCFVGGNWGGTTNSTNTPLIENNIYGGIFEERVYFGGRNGTAEKIHTMIAGGIFNGDRITPSMYQLTASQKVIENILEVKPDESEYPLFFGCNYTAKGGDPRTTSAYASYGLENCTTNKYKDTLILHGASKPIYIAGETLVNFDEVRGEVTFIQTENWINGNVYLTAPTSQDLSGITFLNADGSITGSAQIKTQAANLGTAVAETGVTCNVLVGNNSASAPETVAVPEVAAFNFVLDNNLQVNFFVEEAALANYLEKAGSFTYRITSGDQVLASGTITSMEEAEVVTGYVKIKTEFAIAAFAYGETITIDFAGMQTDYTVYDLLQTGIETSAANAELADLLKAIYNYGVEAEKLYSGSASTATYYDEITYTGTYTGKASAANSADYKFAGTGLSIGKEVSLNFYLKAAETEGLNFIAASANGALDASRVVVTPFAGNASYNVVISLRLDVAAMDDVYTLIVTDAEGTQLAACANSVAYSCAAYIEADNAFAPISGALLAYIEKAQAL